MSSKIIGPEKSKLGGGPLDVPIVHTLYQLYKLLHELLLKFPKSQRYSLGTVLQSQLLIAIEAIVTAAGTTSIEAKVRYLRQASAKIDLLRLLVRLAKDCQCITNQAYLDLESKLHEVGRMLGGWLKSL